MSDAGEIPKSGFADKIADLVNKLAGPMADEAGMMLGDRMRVYRVKNWISTLQKTQRLLDAAGLPANAVPPRLFLPITEACSVEDNDTLQELWAGLLASASQQADALSPSFIETLKQLTPVEARYFDKVYNSLLDAPGHGSPLTVEIHPFSFRTSSGAPAGVAVDTYERLGLIRREYEVTMRTRAIRLTFSDLDADLAEPEIGYTFKLTLYAERFMKACRGPRRSGNL